MQSSANSFCTQRVAIIAIQYAIQSFAHVSCSVLCASLVFVSFRRRRRDGRPHYTPFLPRKNAFNLQCNTPTLQSARGNNKRRRRGSIKRHCPNKNKLTECPVKERNGLVVVLSVSMYWLYRLLSPYMLGLLEHGRSKRLAVELLYNLHLFVPFVILLHHLFDDDAPCI